VRPADDVSLVSIFRRSVTPFLDEDYLPVAMPTTDLQALHVLTRDRDVLRRYSVLDAVLVGEDGVPAPTITMDAPVADVSGSMIRTAKLGLGVSVVSMIVQAFGGTAGLQLSTGSATTVQYGYSGVTADRVDLASLDKWLGAADFDPTARATTGLLAADTCHVVVAVLKARALDVSVLDEHNRAVDLDVPELQSMVGAKVSVTSSGTRAGRMTFMGQTALTVAAKVVQIVMDSDGFSISNRRPGGEIRGGGLGGARNDYRSLDQEELRLGLT
jgi:hypothetical protein